jgi:hypothetical protein
MVSLSVWWIRPTAYSPHTGLNDSPPKPCGRSMRPQDVIDSPQRHGIGRPIFCEYNMVVSKTRIDGLAPRHALSRRAKQKTGYLCIAWKRRRQDICVSVWECHNICFFGTIKRPYLSNTLNLP